MYRTAWLSLRTGIIGPPVSTLSLHPTAPIEARWLIGRRTPAKLWRMTFSESETVRVPEVETPAWQARALERSLADTRARSVARLSETVAAARSLAEETGSSAFTVQQVVARAGQSLKSFYRYFESK